MNVWIRYIKPAAVVVAPSRDLAAAQVNAAFLDLGLRPNAKPEDMYHLPHHNPTTIILTLNNS